MNPMVEIALKTPYNIREIHDIVINNLSESKEILDFFRNFDIISVSTANFEEMVRQQ